MAGSGEDRTNRVWDTDNDAKWLVRNQLVAQRERILLDLPGQLGHVQAVAMSYTDQNVARAGELLRAALIGNDLPAPLPSPYWARYGGRVESAGDRGCPYDHHHIAAMMAEIYAIWADDELGIFKFASCPYVHGNGWGPTRDFYRVFDHDACEQLSERRSSDPEEMAFFAHTAYTHRMIIAHITSLMGCDSLDVDYSYVIKQTHFLGLLAPHYKNERCGHCFVIIIGIYDTDGGV